MESDGSSDQAGGQARCRDNHLSRSMNHRPVVNVRNHPEQVTRSTYLLRAIWIASQWAEAISVATEDTTPISHSWTTNPLADIAFEKVTTRGDGEPQQLYEVLDPAFDVEETARRLWAPRAILET